MTWQELQQVTQLVGPEVWDICHPRVFEQVGNWHSPKVAATALASGALRGITHHNLSTIRNDERNIYLTASLCAKNMMPTFFVTKELLQSVARSSVPDQMRWTDLHMPHPGITWILPHGALRHETEGEVGFITLARMPAGEMVKFPFAGAPAGRIFHDALYCVFGCPLDPTFPIYDVSLSADRSPFISSTANVTSGTTMTYVDAKEQLEPMTLEQTHWNSNVMAIALRLLLIMLARPQLVTEGSMLKRVQRKHGLPTEFWSPNILGKNYKIRRVSSGEPGEPTGRKQPFHYRGGHFKMQPFGPGHAKRKEIWVDDYFAGGNG